MAPEHEYEDDDARKDEAGAGADATFKEFDCPSCNANNPADPPLIMRDTVLCLVDEPDRPAITNLLTIYSVATGRAIIQIEQELAGKGYADLKAGLADALVAFLEPIQKRYEELKSDPDIGARIIHPDDRKVLEEFSAHPEKMAGTMTLRAIRKDGEVVWLEQRMVVLYDENGLPVYVYNAGSDYSYGGRPLGLKAPFGGTASVVGDLVKSAQLLHDQLADLTRRDLGRAATKERGLDLVHQRLDRSGRDGPAMTRRGHATQQFVAAVFLAAPILLDHHEPHALHPLVGRVAPVAAQAFAPPPRGLTVLRVTRVEHLRIGVPRAPGEAAMRTLHARPLSPCCTRYGARIVPTAYYM